MISKGLLIAVSVLISTLCLGGGAKAQPVGTQADCMGMDVTQPLAVLACLRSFPNAHQMVEPSQDCMFYQGSLRSTLERHGLPMFDQQPDSIPSCPVIAKAIEIGAGTPPIWNDCIVLGRVAGTPQHIRNCLVRFVAGGFPGRTAASIKTCDELYERYELGLKYATPINIIRPKTQEDPDPLHGRVIYHGPSPTDDPAIYTPFIETAPVLRKHDCAIAEQVMASFRANPTGPASVGASPTSTLPRSGATDIPTATSPQNTSPASPIVVPVPRVQ